MSDGISDEDKEEAREVQRKKAEALRDLDTSSAWLGDHLPGLWRRIYENLLVQGFKDHEAMELLKTYILSQGSNGVNAK